MKTSRSITVSLSNALLILAALCGNSASAGKLDGTVSKVSGMFVQIDLAGDLLPRLGDRVEIGFDASSVGYIRLSGEWKVTGFLGDRVVAQANGKCRQPQVAHKAAISCANPQTLEALRQAAESLNQQGEDYYYGKNDHQKNLETAHDYLHQAAVLGSADAMVNIGYMYANAEWFAKDEVKAAEWFEKAANLGLSKAQSNMGFMYQFGKGVDRDLATSIAWYRKAVDQNNPTAQRRLGVLYLNGQGLEKDPEVAVRLFRKAAEQGDTPAAENLGIMHETGQGLPQDHQQAIKWYRQAADNGNAGAQYRIGRMHAEGNGVPIDVETARHWFTMAANNGNDDAATALKKLNQPGSRPATP